MKTEVVRNIERDRLDKITALLDKARDHDGHAPLGEHKWLDLVFGKDFVAVVASEGDEVVGYAHLSKHGSGWGLETVVAPEHRAVTEELIARALDVVHEQGGGHVHYWVFRPEEADDAVAAKLGFQKGRDLLHVCVSLPITHDVPMPEGIHVRRFEPGRDERAWLDVNNRAFADHPEQGEWDAETLQRRMKEPWFDADDFHIAADNGDIVGFNWMKLHPERGEGEIYVIGVDPDRKAAGLGKALLVAGLKHMADKGMTTCCLYVDESNGSALAMYEKFGFKEDHRDRAYAIDVH
jgi:mycothiol synthase